MGEPANLVHLGSWLLSRVSGEANPISSEDGGGPLNDAKRSMRYRFHWQAKAKIGCSATLVDHQWQTQGTPSL